MKIDAAALEKSLAGGCSGEVCFNRLTRALYSTDASIYQIIPLGVVLPKTEDDIVHTLRTCAQFRVPLTARGGGTSQAGQAIGAGVILDCSKYFNEVLEINQAERWVRVQPGCVLADLNERLKPLDLQFAPDISTANRATIGGMIANNSSGTRSIIYGKTIDHVLELKVLLSDGTIIQAHPLNEEDLEAKCRQQDVEGQCYRAVRRQLTDCAEEIETRYPKILRRVGGYNLDRLRLAGPKAELDPEYENRNQMLPGDEPTVLNLADLFVGSEGTLGVTLEAKLKLVQLPRSKAVLVVQFHELLQALAATPSILKHGPSAVEVMDQYILNSTKLNTEAARLRDFLDGDPGAILIIEFSSNRSEALTSRLEKLEADLRQRGYGYHYLQAADTSRQQRIWKLRTLALGLSMAEKGDAKSISFVEDTAVCPDHLRDYIEEFLGIISRHHTKAGVYAHASVGCLHVRPVINLKTPEGMAQLQNIAEEVADLVLKYHGALSGEHGDGLVRTPFQEKMFGQVLYQAFRELKNTFDPLNILNPGKIVDPPPFTANLRYGPSYVTPQMPTVFDFTPDGGMTQATELCAGVGECRKRRGDVMCPSYRATLDEQHSTRGRANALRMAITGQCDLSDLSDPAVFEALALCLECKACKSECPTNVDMARLKAEFLHHYYSRHGFPRRNQVLGNVATLSRWGSRLAPVSNWIIRSRMVRWLNERLLGLNRQRMPPRFARRTLVNRLASLPQPDDQAAQTILLFPDTFTNFYQPEIGVAAAQLLQQTGDVVSLGPPALRCCGRPMISTGLLVQAVKNAEHNVKCLYPWAEQGKPIMACEPSCILTIKDDYPALLRGETQRRAEVVAAMCVTFEELMEQSVRDSGAAFRPGPSDILVQSHCHQRSLTGMKPTLDLLKRIPNARIIDLNAGCCGMAGSFGYETEHYDVSRLVGETQLFPALRRAAPYAVVVASGFSCRLQIEHFVGRRALHPAELLAELGA